MAPELRPLSQKPWHLPWLPLPPQLPAFSQLSNPAIPSWESTWNLFSSFISTSPALAQDSVRSLWASAIVSLQCPIPGPLHFLLKEITHLKCSPLILYTAHSFSSLRPQGENHLLSGVPAYQTQSRLPPAWGQFPWWLSSQSVIISSLSLMKTSALACLQLYSHNPV